MIYVLWLKLQRTCSRGCSATVNFIFWKISLTLYSLSPPIGARSTLQCPTLPCRLSGLTKPCKPYKESRNRFLADTRVRQPYLNYRSARLYRLAESIHWSMPGLLKRLQIRALVFLYRTFRVDQRSPQSSLSGHYCDSYCVILHLWPYISTPVF
jgi:hypothetical protein